MTPKIQTISDVVACNLCTGCGACAGVFPQAFRLIEDATHGRRPVAEQPYSEEDHAALAVCAGIGAPEPKPNDDVEVNWGPVLACWEGYASDPEIRYRGSSGGAVTALANFALQKGAVGGVAHVQARTDDPRFNEARISRNQKELIRGAGSRYAQASPLEILPKLMKEAQPVAFIGKPCDVASLAKARKRDNALDARIGLTISIFCAGAPNLTATGDLLDRLGVPKGATLTDLRYRGKGWPGLMQARWLDFDGEERVSEGIPYAEGWGNILQKGRRWRCRICDDHTGVSADISVGDPWHSPPQGHEDIGQSLIVARTEVGRMLIEAAIADGILVAEPRPRDIISKAQPNLLTANASVWGRRAAMQLLGMPVPQANAASSFAIWSRRLDAKSKAQSVLGTIRRIIRGKVNRPAQLTPVE